MQHALERQRAVALLVVVHRVDGVVLDEPADRQAVLLVVVGMQLLGLVLVEAESAEVVADPVGHELGDAA